MNKKDNLKANFELRGEVISDWAKKEGFDKRNVYAVISGRNKGNRGEGHKIAVRLGLKPDYEKLEEEKK